MNETAEKVWVKFMSKRVRFMLYALVLLAALAGTAWAGDNGEAASVSRQVDEDAAMKKEFVTQETLRRKARKADSPAEKVRVYDDYLKQHDGQLSDSLTAWLMNEKAEVTEDPAEKIALYDAMLARFLPSADDSIFSWALGAAMDKVELIDDKNEQLRLCNIVIDSCLKTPQRTQHYHLANALEKKAELTNDPVLPLRTYDKIIADNLTEESVAMARNRRLRLIKNDQEWLAGCDELIAAHQASDSKRVQNLVVGAMYQKADHLTDRDAKLAQWLAVVKKCAQVDTPQVILLARKSVAALAEHSGDIAAVARQFDEAVAQAKNDLEAIRLLESKVWLFKTPAEKVRVYDEIIARGRNSKDQQVSGAATGAMFEKLQFIDDPAEEIKLFDELIEMVAKSSEGSESERRAWISSLMLFKTPTIDDKAAKMSIYDEVLSRGRSSNNKEDWEPTAMAMFEKAKLIDDREEKIRLYDALLFEMIPVLDSLPFGFPVDDILQERAKLVDEVPEKSVLYDRVIERYQNIDTDSAKKVMDEAIAAKSKLEAQ
ncbi:MAG: hypothetical protein LBV79_11445 [Candidatus Adiutrix sp.]|jgi:hypothetical protein|nr:hypothetical protein [Candidatus Adiutrix sp.]